MAGACKNPLDIHVGGRVKIRGSILGLSQTQLGDQLGVTFQQVQKYEKGHNRIGASRLYHIAQILGVPVAYFFEGLGPIDEVHAGAKNSDTVDAFLSSSGALELCRAFARIEDPGLQSRVLKLVQAMGDGE